VTLVLYRRRLDAVGRVQQHDKKWGGHPTVMPSGRPKTRLEHAPVVDNVSESSVFESSGEELADSVVKFGHPYIPLCSNQTFFHKHFLDARPQRRPWAVFTGRPRELRVSERVCGARMAGFYRQEHLERTALAVADEPASMPRATRDVGNAVRTIRDPAPDRFQSQKRALGALQPKPIA
jgi:hypothetical protein